MRRINCSFLHRNLLVVLLAFGLPPAACSNSHSAGVPSDGGLGADSSVAGGAGGGTEPGAGGRNGTGGGIETGGASSVGGRTGAGGGTATGGRGGAGGGGGPGTGGKYGTGGSGRDGGPGTGGKGGLDAAAGASGGFAGSVDGGSTSTFNGGYAIGMNLDGISYWSSYAPFVDMARAICANDENTCWDNTDGSAGVSIDSHGYPTTAAQAGMWAPYPSGTYAVTWEGTGTFDITASGGGKFTKTGANAGTLDFVKGSQLFPKVVKPPVTNIHIMSPQSEYDPGHKYRRAFLHKLQPFSTLRTMDLMKTNSNDAIKWSERSWPEDFSNGKAHGVPFEDLVSLANESGKNLWINIPVLADDDFVCRAARLLRYGEHGDRSDAACDPAAPGNPPADAVPLDASLTLYVEFSNELWNWGFDAPHSVFCMVWGKGDGAYKTPPEDATCPWNITAPTSAIGAAALKDTTLPWQNDNVWGKSSQFAAVLVRRVSTIFKTVYKDAPGQLKIVLGGQSAYADGDASTQLSFLSAAYGDVTKIVDVLAMAPYLDILDADGNPVSLTGSTQAAQLDSLFTALDSSLSKTVAAWLASDKKLADKYRLPLVAYEGGQGLSGTSYQDAKVAAQSDPRMYDVTRKYFKLWHDTAGANALFNYYSFASDTGQYGSWGALTDGDQAGSQKWDALMSLLRPAGDANLDGHVDGADSAIIQSNLNKTGMWWEQGDFNHDGTVNQADVDLYNQNLGM